ncbi:unnamed protein product, partial [Closterium sp. NIES-53]
ASIASQRVSPRSPAPALRRLLLLLLLLALLLLVRGSRGGAERGEERREGKAEEKEDDEEEGARRATIGLLAHGWNDVREWRAGLVKGVEYVKIDFSWMPPARCKLQVGPHWQYNPHGCFGLVHSLTWLSRQLNTSDDVIAFLRDPANRVLLTYPRPRLYIQLCPKNRPILCTTNHTRAAVSSHVTSHDMPRGDAAAEKAIRMHHVVPRGSSARVLRVMARATASSSKNNTTNAGASGASGIGASETGESGAGTSVASGARQGGDGIRWGDEGVRQWMRLFDDFFLRASTSLQELRLNVEFFLNDMGGKCVAQRWRPWVIAWDDNDLTSHPATTNDPSDASDRFQVLNHDATFTWWAAAAQQQFMKFKDSAYALVLYEPQ